MCAQWRLKSVQIDQNFCCAYEENLLPCLPRIYLWKILIRLRECWAHMFEGMFSNVDAHIKDKTRHHKKNKKKKKKKKNNNKKKKQKKTI